MLHRRCLNSLNLVSLTLPNNQRMLSSLSNQMHSNLSMSSNLVNLLRHIPNSLRNLAHLARWLQHLSMLSIPTSRQVMSTLGGQAQPNLVPPHA